MSAVAIVIGGSLLTAGISMYLRELVGSWALTLCLVGAFYLGIAAALQLRSR
jgi:ribose/xylose/arabinose/galactoside ABC-type transport system permease subunit